MAIDPKTFARRNSQRAPFPGSGANVQNAAMSSALQGSAERELPGGVPAGAPMAPGDVPEAPRIVQPPQTAPAPPPPGTSPSTTSPYAGKWGYDTVKSAYKNYTGRDAQDDEVMGMVGSAMDYSPENSPTITSAVQHIYNGPEARTFRGRPGVNQTMPASTPSGATREAPLASSPGAPPTASAASLIAEYYQIHTGKMATPAQIAQWTAQYPNIEKDQAGLESIYAIIYNSPEAVEYRWTETGAAGPPPGGAPGGTTPPPGGGTTTTTPPPTGTPSPYGVGGGNWGANYEWTPTEGGPKVSDLLAKAGPHTNGFNAAGWGTGERGTESSKNTFGMILSKYDPADPAARDKLFADPDFKTFFPNAQPVGDDKIDFGDGMPVDFWVNWAPGKGGTSWAYQPPGGGGGGAYSGGGASAGASAPPNLLAGMNQFNPNDPLFYQKLLAYLMQQLGGGAQ